MNLFAVETLNQEETKSSSSLFNRLLYWMKLSFDNTKHSGDLQFSVAELEQMQMEKILLFHKGSNALSCYGLNCREEEFLPELEQDRVQRILQQLVQSEPIVPKFMTIDYTSRPNTWLSILNTKRWLLLTEASARDLLNAKLMVRNFMKTLITNMESDLLEELDPAFFELHNLSDGCKECISCTESDSCFPKISILQLE